ncbi:uncharacterized protein LOC119690074 [Teleopsis dalmanni]|uniref:uncharacterized protein LOC119690074 n=1 Tax=Teleopsis dalmanni TaxID=139649 RepID=UPI0018CDD2F0|nr:uncharacterized protein LOC119690074 [Teleopsis dalmanni]XP_037960991.1 uncharacterized protein LOC119690074 [Teleopsis dalmanni]
MDQSSQKKSNKRVKYLWTESCEQLFVELWEKNVSQLPGYRRSDLIYKDMTKLMCERGYIVTNPQVLRKVDNFTKRFRKEQQIVRVSEGSPSTWKFFNNLNRIMENWPNYGFSALVSNSFEDQKPEPLGSASSPLSSTTSEVSEDNTEKTPRRKRKMDDAETQERLDKLINLQEQFLHLLDNANKNHNELIKTLHSRNNVLTRIAAAIERRYQHERVVTDVDSSD